MRRPSPHSLPLPSASPWWLEEALGWEASEGPYEAAPQLHGSTTADVAVVGGGFTGLWTAHSLLERRADLRVVVLEAEICGWGASGRNGGFLHGYWTQLGHLRKLFGDQGALAVARAASGAIPAARKFSTERGEDFWLRESGMIKVSAAPAQDAAIERSIRAAAELGVQEEAQALSPEDVAASCSSPVFRRGVFFRDAATIQPARLVRALRRAVLGAGGLVYERTPVVRLAQGRPNVLETPSGLVRASHAVVAINTAAARQRPFSRWLTNFGSSVVLTAPVPELLAEIGWTKGEAITDGRMFIHYFRTTPDHRVLMGSGSGPMAFSRQGDERLPLDVGTAARAAAGVRRLLPRIATGSLDRAWGGAVDVSADNAPCFGTLPGTQIHYGLGYCGHGVAPAWLGGQILASLVTRADDEWSSLPLVNREVAHFPPAPIRVLGAAAVRRAMLACENAEERGVAPRRSAVFFASLPRAFGIQVGTRVRD